MQIILTRNISLFLISDSLNAVCSKGYLNSRCLHSNHYSVSLFVICTQTLKFQPETFQEMYNPTEIQYSLESDFKFIVSANWFLCLPPPPPSPH